MWLFEFCDLKLKDVIYRFGPKLPSRIWKGQEASISVTNALQYRNTQEQSTVLKGKVPKGCPRPYPLLNLNQQMALETLGTGLSVFKDLENCCKLKWIYACSWPSMFSEKKTQLFLGLKFDIFKKVLRLCKYFSKCCLILYEPVTQLCKTCLMFVIDFSQKEGFFTLQIEKDEFI